MEIEKLEQKLFEMRYVISQNYMYKDHISKTYVDADDMYEDIIVNGFTFVDIATIMVFFREEYIMELYNEDDYYIGYIEVKKIRSIKLA